MSVSDSGCRKSETSFIVDAAESVEDDDMVNSGGGGGGGGRVEGAGSIRDDCTHEKQRHKCRWIGHRWM